MGFLEDLEKALNDFDEWLGEWEFEEPEEEYEEPEYEYVDDDFFAPVADFFENLDKGTDEIVTDFVGELLGKKDEEPKEQWYAYYWTYDGGYWGTYWINSESGVLYSTNENAEDEILYHIYEVYEERYYGGQGLEVEPSVNEPYEVDEDEVDRNNIL